MQRNYNQTSQKELSIYKAHNSFSHYKRCDIIKKNDASFVVCTKIVIFSLVKQPFWILFNCYFVTVIHLMH
jgi:hypothetical protein